MVVQKSGKQVKKNTEVFGFQKSKFIFSKSLVALILCAGDKMVVFLSKNKCS